jgi:hypothetical protein
VAITALNTLQRERHNAYRTAVNNGETPEPAEPKIIVIPSYTELKYSLTEDTAFEFDTLLKRGSPSYNILVILGEHSRNLDAILQTPWYKQHFNDKIQHAIWVGSGFREPYCLDVSNPTIHMREPLTPQFAYSLIKSKAVKLKLLNSETGGNTP